MLIDSHCHLDFPQFDADRAAVLDRARAAGVRVIVNPGADLASSRRAVALAEAEPGVYAAVGVHPHDADTVDDAVLSVLRDLAVHPKVVAIGEIGLDFYRDLSPRDRQQEAFERQLDLAAELRLPVIIHCREAQSQVMATLRAWADRHPPPEGGYRGVLHAFAGDKAMAEAGRAMGFLIALGGPVTFRNARRLHALVPELPLDSLLLETDAPYLSPHPYRGKRNEPARLTLIAEAVARLQGVSVEEVARRTTDNAIRLFRLSGLGGDGETFVGV
ncbi:MAG: TatD family hydrolase [Chloroflexi bacterium]|nr:TatD family hydrolase [Chloroflexota bacterium]